MDARVVRTRQALTHALLDLIQERRWEKITVQDLLDRTGVSRSTFYAHYDNKLDVLLSELPDVTGMIVMDEGGLDLHPLFEHVGEMAGVFAPLLSQPVLGEINARFERELADSLRTATGCSTLLARFVAGGLISTIRDYTADRRRPAPAVVAAEVESHLDRLFAG